MQIGGLFENLAKRANKISIARGFHHKDSNHSTATHWLMSGQRNQGGTIQNYPSFGAMTSGYYGPTTKPYGMPTYVKLNKIDGDGPSWMGQQYMGYDANPQGVSDLQLKIGKDRFSKRFSILNSVESMSEFGNNGNDWLELQKQAEQVLTGKASEAFLIEKDSEFEDYKSDGLGKDILTAMRLVEHGAKFVNLSFGGWDMHNNIVNGLKSRQTVLDQYLSKMIDSLEKRGLSHRTLLIVTSEFGRTPRINSTAGRDHWSGLVPLMMSCDSYEMGRVIGKSNDMAEFAENGLCTPEDLRWTILNHIGLEKGNTWLSVEGRPMPITGTEEKNILTDIKES